MVFVSKKKVGKETYYYLAYNKRAENGKWKSFREYVGKEMPNAKKLDGIKKEFIRKNQIPVKRKFLYADEERIAKMDFIIGEFQKKVKDYPKIALEKIDRDFTIKFTYNSNAIEGNTVSLVETAALLNKKIVPQGKSLREIHEITNTEKALNFIKEYESDLTKRLILKLHGIIMANIDDESAGKIRTYDVSIQGANWMPPRANHVEEKFDGFLQWYSKNEKRLHPIELAAIAHLKFIEVHPFGDGNGRIARLITNLILMKRGYPPINIKVRDTIPYVKILQYSQNTQKFDKLVDWFLQKLGEQYVEIIQKE